jgi:tetratricopeptide (TPR) repeat protein
MGVMRCQIRGLFSLRRWLWPIGTLALSLGIGLSAQPALGQGRAGSETEEEAILKKAEEHFQNGDYDSAAELYDQAIKLDPNRVEAFVKRASLYFRERKYDQAIELLTRAEKLSVSDLSVKTALGLTLYESGQRERGLGYLEEVARQRPETHGAQFQIGKHYARLNPQRATQALEQFFRYRPDEDKRNDWEAQLLLGTSYYLAGNLVESRKLLEKAQDARPRDNQVRQMLGTVLIAQQKWAEGAAQYEPLQSDVQRRPAVAFNLATCYLHMGRRDEARKLALTYQGLRPDDPRGAILLAQIEQAGDREADYREAIKRYHEAQELLKKQAGQTSKVNVPAAIGRAYLKLNDPTRAGQTAEAALAELSGRPAAEGATVDEVQLLALALESRLLQMNQGKVGPGGGPPGLLSQADKLAQLAPSDAKVLALAGSGAYAAGNFDKARRYYTDSQQLDDKVPRSRLGLAKTLEQLALLAIVSSGDLSDAAKDAKDAAKVTEQKTALGNAVGLLRQAQKLDDSPSVVRNLATALIIQGNGSEAERLVATALAGSGKSDPLLWVVQARLLGGQKQLPQAAEAADRAVVEARKQLDNLPGADGGRRPILLKQLSAARIEQAARYLALEAARTTPTTAKDRERLDSGIDGTQLAVRDLTSLWPAGGADGKELIKAAQRNLQLLHLRRGKLRLSEVETHISRSGVTAQTTKESEDALADIQKAIELGGFEQKSELGYAQCLGSVAGAQANQFKTARDLIAKAKDNGCELVAPYNRLGTELISVFVQYRASTAPMQREALLRTLPRLQGKATGTDSGTLLKVLRALLYSTNLALAYDYHLMGRSKLVGPTLRNAQKVLPQRAENDEDSVLSHNLAVADLIEGKPGGERVLERLAPNPPESLVNLGILHDRRGEARKALDFYKRAAEKGARSAKLREWIDTKDRMIGSGQTP